MLEFVTTAVSGVRFNERRDHEFMTSVAVLGCWTSYLITSRLEQLHLIVVINVLEGGVG